MIDQEMQAIPLQEILNQPTIPADTYIRLSPNKFILIAKSGAPTPQEALQKYKAKNVTSLYVSIEDYRRLVLSTFASHDGAPSSPTKTKEQGRFAVLQEAMEAVYRQAVDVGFNDAIFNQAKIVNHATLSFVMSNSELKDLIFKLEKVEPKSIQHSMMVSMVSVMIGVAMKWSKPATLEKLALGGFLHDLGLTKLPSELLVKPYRSMSSDERVIFESHPETGKALIARAKAVPDDILMIIVEHHERADGSGFPRRLKDFHISPLARVVALANEFAERLLDSPVPLSLTVAKRVFEDLETNARGQFNRDAMKALKSVVEGESFQVAG